MGGFPAVPAATSGPALFTRHGRIEAMSNSLFKIGSGAAATREAAFRSHAYQGASVATMTVDRDLVVTSANAVAQKLFADNADAFRACWPGFSPDRMVGACLDAFDKISNQHRRLAADPARMSERIEISVGELEFAVNVSAVVDAKRVHLGSVIDTLRTIG